MFRNSDLLVFAIRYASLEDSFDDILKSRIYLAFTDSFFGLEFNISVDRLGCIRCKQAKSEIGRIVLTCDGFCVFFGPRSATFGVERVSRTKGERKSLIVLPEKVVYFARQEGSRSSRILSQIIAFI